MWTPTKFFLLKRRAFLLLFFSNAGKKKQNSNIWNTLMKFSGNPLFHCFQCLHLPPLYDNLDKRTLLSAFMTWMLCFAHSNLCKHSTFFSLYFVSNSLFNVNIQFLRNYQSRFHQTILFLARKNRKKKKCWITFFLAFKNTFNRINAKNISPFNNKLTLLLLGLPFHLQRRQKPNHVQHGNLAPQD